MKLSRMPVAALTAAALVLGIAGGIARGEDCNSNGVEDALDIARGNSRDCNANAVPDECDFSGEDAQFEIARRYEVGRNAAEIVGSDFDHDGDTDLAITSRPRRIPGEETDVEGIIVLQNDGGFRFSEMAFVQTMENDLGVERRPLDLYGVDLNGDGHEDLLAQLRLSSEIVWSLNNGDGTFSAPFYLNLMNQQVGSMVMADLDGDGDVDIVASSRMGSRLTTVLNDGNGGLELAGRIRVGINAHVIAADFDGDGDPDLAAIQRGTVDEPRGFLHVLLNRGDATFEAPDIHAVGDLPKSQDGRVATADLDGDSVLDLMVSNTGSHEISILIGRGDGSFASPVNYPTGLFPELLTLADFDGDGDLDVATTGKSRIHRGPEDLTVLLNDGDGTFAAPEVYRIGDHQQPQRIEAADMNGDTHLDIFIGNYWEANVAIFQNRGDGSFENVGSHPVSHGAASDMVVDDLDGDGDLDVATVSIIYNNGLSVLENVTAEGFNRGCGEFVRGDVNMDGSVSVADIVMLRRFLFQGLFAPPCEDAADATDNDLLSICDAVAIIDVLFRVPDWHERLPMPSPEPGIDPTVFSDVGEDNTRGCSGNVQPTFPLGCADHDETPSQESDDVVTIGSVEAEPGQTVQVPITLSTDVQVEALQLVVEYDTELLDFDPEGVSFENTYFDRFEDVHPTAMLTNHPEAGVFTLLLAGNLLLPGSEIEPGTDLVIAWLTVTVSDQAASGTVLELTPTNGPGGDGVGPYRLRNELVHEGAARFLSVRPVTRPGLMNIVGDQSFFIRADSNGDGRVDVSDAVHTLSALFLGGEPTDCQDAADANDDGAINLSDASATLNFLFIDNRATLPPPHPRRGTDPTGDPLTCRRAPVAR